MLKPQTSSSRLMHASAGTEIQSTVVYREVRQQQHPPECVLGWVRRAGVGADSQWECWRAEEDGWNPSGERMTEELIV